MTMKKTFSFVLMAAMLLVSGVARATDPIEVTDADALTTALTDVTEGGTILLTQDITANEGFGFGKAISATLDLGGFTLKVTNDNGHSHRAIKVTNGNLTIQNGTIDARNVNAKGEPEDYNVDKSGPYTNGIYGTLRVEGNKATATLNNLVLYNNHCWGLSVKVCSGNTVTMNNCVINSRVGGGCEAAGGTITINRCEFFQTETSKYGVHISSAITASTGTGVVNVLNSTFEAKGYYAMFVYDSGGTLNIKGGIFDGTKTSVQLAGASLATFKKQYLAAHPGATDAEVQEAYNAVLSSGEGATSILNVEGGYFKTPILYSNIDLCAVRISGGRFVNGQPSSGQGISIKAGCEIVDNGDGTWSVVKTEEKKTDFTESTKESVVIPAANETIPTGTTKEAKQVTLKGKDITVQNGAILSVGDGGIIVGKDGEDKYGKVIVEAGGKLVVDGMVYNDNAANMIVEAKEGQNGYFLISPDVQLYGTNHPKGTVELYSKAYNKGDGTYVWQRFGVPSYLGNVKRSDVVYDHTAYPTSIMRWDYQQSSWLSMEDNETFEPFQCYTLTTSNTDAVNRATYSFGCDLVGNGDATLPINAEWNYYANSYTAPISLSTLATDIFTNNNTNISAAIWIYRASDNWWDVVSYMDVLEGTVPQNNKNIEPMQAFILQKIAPVSEKVLDYKTNVWNTVVTPAPSAPARKQAANDWTVATIHFTNESGYADKVRIIEGADFSDEFDNGFDVAKYMNPDAFNVFAETENGAEISVAKDNLEDQMISLNTKAETSFTMTFSNVRGSEYSIKDMLTGTITPIVEGGEYVFSAQANSNNKDRFMLVPSHKQPTAIENVNTEVAKGIYSVMGQYIGETSEWNNIPAGVYVVDGVKIVK